MPGYTPFFSPNRRFFTVIGVIQLEFGISYRISTFCIWNRQLPLWPAYIYPSFDKWRYIRHSDFWIDCWLIKATRSTFFSSQLHGIRHCFKAVEYFAFALDIFYIISLSFYGLNTYISCIRFMVRKLSSKYCSLILDFIFCYLWSMIIRYICMYNIALQMH